MLTKIALFYTCLLSLSLHTSSLTSTSRRRKPINTNADQSPHSTRRKNLKSSIKKPKSSKATLAKTCRHLSKNPDFMNYLLNLDSNNNDFVDRCGSSRCCRDPIWSMHQSQSFILMNQFQKIFWKEELEFWTGVVLESLGQDLDQIFQGDFSDYPDLTPIQTPDDYAYYTVEFG